MFTFACKTIRKEDIIKCALGLNKTEYTILEFFFKKGKSQSVKKIYQTLGFERTTVQKALKNLMKKNLVKRKKVDLKKGGYVFLYELNDKNKIKNRIKSTVSAWSKHAIRKIDEI